MWTIGQDIVCIKTHSQGGVKEGEVYSIKALRKVCCTVQIHVGKLSDKKNAVCGCGKKELSNGLFWFCETLFKPLDELSDISEILEHLEQEDFEKV